MPDSPPRIILDTNVLYAGLYSASGKSHQLLRVIADGLKGAWFNSGCLAGGATTWHGFIEAIIATALERGLLEKSIPVHRITSAEFPTPAQRPGYSLLDCGKLERNFGLRMPDWAMGAGS